LSRLTATDLQEIFRRIRTLGNVTDEQKMAAIRQFLKSAGDMKVQASVAPRRENIAAANEHGPFDFLAEADDSMRLRVLASEHPRVIAIVLSFLPAAQAATTLNLFESETRVSILRRLCEMESVAEDEIARLSKQLQASLYQLSRAASGPSGGIGSARRMLSCSDPEVRESTLASLQQRDPTLARELRQSLFQFEDLVRLSNDDIRTVLKHVDTSLWAPALKLASLPIRKKVLLNMAVRPREILNQEMQSIRRIDAYIRSAAQAQIISHCVQLAEKSLISLPTEKPS
jgi:flagellar motor switch protein FliG